MDLRTIFYGLIVIASLTGCGPSGSAGNSDPVTAASDGNNSAPVASADRMVLTPGTSGKIAVLVNDTDPDNDPISIISVATPAHGAAIIDTNGTPDVFHDDTILYTPAANYLGIDTFSYTIGDSGNGRASSFVSVVVGVNPVTFGAPLAQNDAVSTTADKLVSIPVLENDFDSDGDTLVITSISPPSHGTALIDDGGTPMDRSDDSLSYQPATGYAGPDSFLYTITDGTTAVTAAVSVDVMPATPAGILAAKVTGVVMKGPMIGAQIRLFSLGGDGHKSAVVPVAQTVTDASGYWEAFVPLPRVDLLVVSSSGAYQDEAQQQDSPNKRYVRFGNSESLETILPGTDTHSVLSVYSNALLLRSRYHTVSSDFMNKHGQARSAATTAFGFDPLVADATNPSGPAANSSDEARRHALVLGGAANAINRISTSLGKTEPDHEMVYALVRDLSDCRLDGKDLYGPITFTFGGVPVTMPANINLNAEILRFRNNNFDNYTNTPLATVDTTLCTSPLPTVDTTAPVISILGSDPLPVTLNAVFSDPGVTAVDNLDGDITGAITISGTVDTSVPGTYLLTYAVSDAAGNTASIARTVVVVPGSSPVITLLGASSIVLEAGTAYIDAGASAADPEDGDLSSLIVTGNPVDTFVPGTYTVTYSVTDSDGLPATTISRTVVVVDTTPPALTLIGAAVVNIQENDPYTDAGATALDIVDGDLSAAITITNPVDTSVTGSYTVTYQVTDTVGNIVTAGRTVNVIPSGTPSIILTGAPITNVEVASIYTDAGATAFDPEDGDISVAVVVVNLVDTFVRGTYVITYNVVDSDGNPAAEVTRTVIVADTAAPVITLIGPTATLLLSGAPYVDMGATAFDSFDGDLSASIVTANPVDTSTVGSYTVRYNVSDTSGNPATQVTRAVTITSNNIPVISLTGAASVMHEAATPYVDMGATASDVEDGDLTASIVTVDTVDPGIQGSYAVTYDVTDSDSNAAVQLTRIVNVVDTTRPLITLVGPALFFVEVATTFTDPGYIASDTLDGDLAGSVFVSGSVNTSISGDYILNYDVTDGAGNTALSVTRTVQVRDTTVPVIALTGPSPQIIEASSAYTELGATATDNLDAVAAITAAIVIDASAVNTGALGTYTVTYDVTDVNGNVAVTVNRSVQVVDTTIPVIALTGPSPQIIEAGSAYTELGATATDNLDSVAAITAAIVIDASAVNTGAVGTYVVNYDVADANGNVAVTVNRSVQVVDNTIPVITLTGASPQIIEAGDAYVELGATAADSLDGDVSASIVIDASSVDTSTSGSYIVTYDVMDAAGNAATQVTRTVTVQDTTAPIITLLSTDPLNVAQSSVYTDPGATASDILDGDVTASIVIDASAVDTNTLGTYSVNFTVSDTAGNVANATRTVNVTPDMGFVASISPVDGATAVPLASNILVTFNEPMNPATIDSAHIVLSEFSNGSPSIATVVFWDSGTLTATIDPVSDLKDSTTYHVIVQNLIENAAFEKQGFKVKTTFTTVDTTIPVIALTGASPQTIEAGSAYVEQGATATDNLDTVAAITAAIVIDASAVNTSAVGTYTVTYDVTDANGNVAITVNRSVQVVDTTIPVITLTGASPQIIEAGSAYTELGATATDNLDTVAAITSAIVINASAVNTGALGTYTVTYDVTDANGNVAVTVNRSVQVVDTTLPVITLTGASPQTIEAGSAYTELGATATDNLDAGAAITSAIVIDASAVNTGALGTYTVTYDVTDANGNVAVTVNRSVQVVDTTKPVIALLGSDPEMVAAGSGPYTDPGATASDSYDGDITAFIVPGGDAVDTTTPDVFRLFYNVTDSSGNNANPVTRTVHVLPAGQLSDADGDGISDDIELAIAGSINATQTNTFFVDPDPAITIRDGATWATAYEDIEDIADANILNPGFLPFGASAMAPTYVVVGDTSAYPATVGDPNRWRIPTASGNCSNIAIIGSMTPTTYHPGIGQDEPSTFLNVPGGRIIDAGNCTNLQFYHVQFVDSGGTGVANGGAALITTASSNVFDSVVFDNNQASISGGAMEIGNSFSPTVVRNSIFRNNYVSSGAAIGGGAVYLRNNASGDFADTQFIDNYVISGNGGAINAVQNADIQITRSVLSGNEAGGSGGALYMTRNNPVGNSVISHSLFSGNDAGNEGGAIYNFCNDFSPPLRFFNNLITGNAALRGGGLAIDDCDAVEYDNNTIAMNEARTAAGGGGFHIDTASLAAPNFRPMPVVDDNVIYGNIDPGGTSAYSINNLPSFDQQESHENLMDDATSASIQDTVMADPALEFGAGWYLLPTSQAIDLSQTNATSATKFQATPARTTDQTGAADTAKADAGYHYPGAYSGAAMLAITDSRLQGNAGTARQNLGVTLLDVNGLRLDFGNRVSLEIAPGSAPVNPRLASTARFAGDPPAATVATDLGAGDYQIEVDTNTVTGPDNVYVDVYVDGLFINQVTIPVDP